jgi:hypothetical protein
VGASGAPELIKENADHAAVRAWIGSLTPGRLKSLNRRLGAHLRALYHRQNSPESAPLPEAQKMPNALGFKEIAKARQALQLGRLADAASFLANKQDISDEVEELRGIIARLRQPWDGTEPPVLLWRCDSRSYWELDWIRELLAGVTFLDRTSEEGDVFAAHMVVCDNRLTPTRANYYREAFKRGHRVHLIHLSDEWFQDDTTAYRFCETVFRNQWSPLLARQRHVHAFPLGYKAGFTTGLVERPTDVRKFVWSFAGHSLSSSRVQMLESMRQIPRHHTHLATEFNSPDGLSQDDYRALMQDTIFAPCPVGFSTPDTFRACEALEAGCIPIVERGDGINYFQGLFGRHPLPCVETWQEGPEVVQNAYSSGSVARLQQECVAWWQALKRKTNTIFRVCLDSSERQAKVLQCFTPL